MKKQLVRLLDKLPYIKGLKKDLINYEKWGLPGHFYNPIPDIQDFNNFEKSNSYSDFNKEIHLNEDEQIKLLETFIPYYNEMPFSDEASELNLYYFNNPNYSYADAIFYYCMLRYTKPKKVIEIGSGYSSCLLLDVNRIFYNQEIKTTFIEPYPDLLKKLSKGVSLNLVEEKIQSADIALFKSLDSNDLLFIDSSHVLKAGSDLNHIFFNILPELNPGVYIHFHDIFDRFTYPKEWITKEHRAWNELYALRLFLMHNDSYKIVAFNHFLIRKHSNWFENNMPLCLKNTGGSIWLKKIK